MARRRGARQAKGARGATSGSTTTRLRRLSDDFRERRYEPKASQRQVITVFSLAFGGIALGVGVYGMWIRDEALEPLGYAPYMLGVGAVLVLIYLLFGHELLGALRVGELGIGFEKEGKVNRTAWCELTNISLTHGALSVKSHGKPLTISLQRHPEAVRRIVTEALRRVPKAVELDDEDLNRIGEPTSGAGEELSAEPPQVAGLFCAASDKPLTFEKDVRMCSRCSALYHRTAVPRRCVSCGTKLRSS